MDATNFVQDAPLESYTRTGDPDDFSHPAANPDGTTTPVVLDQDFGYEPAGGSPARTSIAAPPATGSASRRRPGRATCPSKRGPTASCRPPPAPGSSSTRAPRPTTSSSPSAAWPRGRSGSPRIAGGSGVLNAMTCVVALHDSPYYDSPGEDLVLDADGGPVVAVGPSGLSLNSHAVQLNATLLDEVSANGQPILGDAVDETMRRNAALH